MQAGDTALSVAQQYGIDYDTQVAALTQCIGYQEGNFLNVGQSICLAPFYPTCKYVVATDPADDECKVYTVQQGDTMTSIASSFNIYTDWLVQLNGASVAPGQRIKLPPWYSRCPDLTSTDNPPCRVYRVKDGDSLYTIANGFHTSVDGIVSVNPGFVAGTVLSTGQPVNIPPFSANCGAGTEVAGFPTTGITVCRAYRVQTGDSVYSIAQAFGTASSDLVALNPELNNPALLSPGSAIKIPPWDDTCQPDGVVVPNPTATPTTNTTTVPMTPPGPAIVSAPVPALPAVPSPPPRLVVNTTTLTTPPPAVVINMTTVATPPPMVVVMPPPPAVNTTDNTTVVVQQKSKVEMYITGVSKDAFSVKQQAVVAAIADAAGVPTTSVSITFVIPALSPSRRLLVTNDGVKVQALVTGDPTSIESGLQNAQQAGTLQSSFASQGLTLNTMTFIDPNGQPTVIVASAAPVIVAPSNSTSSSSGSSLPLPLGILIAAAVGGALLIIAVIWICCCCCKRQKRKREKAALAAASARRRASASASKRYPTVNAYVTTNGSLSGKSGSGEDLRDYKKGGYSSRSQSRSPSRSQSRSPHRSPSRRNLQESQNYVISTSVSTPKYEETKLDIPSQPPSSTASMADTLNEEHQNVVVPVTAPPPVMVAAPAPAAPPPPPPPPPRVVPIVVEPEPVVEESSTPVPVMAAPVVVRPLPRVATARSSSFSTTVNRTPSGRVAAPYSQQQQQRQQQPSPNTLAFTSPGADRPMEASPFQSRASLGRTPPARVSTIPRRGDGTAASAGKNSSSYVSPYSQKTLMSGGSTTERIGARVSPSGPKMSLPSARGGSPAKGSYVSPYSQQNLTSRSSRPDVSPTRRPPSAAANRLSSYTEY